MGPHRRVGIEPLSCHKRGVFSCRGVDGRVPDGNSGSARRAYGHVAKGVDALSSNGAKQQAVDAEAERMGKFLPSLGIEFKHIGLLSPTPLGIGKSLDFTYSGDRHTIILRNSIS